MPRHIRGTLSELSNGHNGTMRKLEFLMKSKVLLRISISCSMLTIGTPLSADAASLALDVDFA